MREKVMFCLILHRIGASEEWVKIGRRELQQELSRVSGGRVSSSLKALCEFGLLERREPRKLEAPYRYRINYSFLESELCRDWQALSAVLFSAEYPWKKLLRRPSVGHGYLNPSGILVLGAIVAAGVEISTGKIQIYLQGLVGESTVKTCVKSLIGEGVVLRNEHGLLIPSSDWEAKLSRYETDVGAKNRSKKITRNVKNQRANFFLFVFGYTKPN